MVANFVQLAGLLLATSATLASGFVTPAGCLYGMGRLSGRHAVSSVSSRLLPGFSRPAAGIHTKAPLPFHRVSRAAPGLRMTASIPTADVQPHVDFLQMTVPDRVHPSPKQLELLARILLSQGHTLVDPADRKELHPYMVPLARDSATGSVTGLLYDVNTPVSVAPPLVRTSGKGLQLVSPSVDYAVKRLVIELDYASDAPELVKLATSNGLLIEQGAAKASKLGLERYLLVNAGPSPDLYEWLVSDWLGKLKTEEALITCARAARQPVLQDWGVTHVLHSVTLRKVGDMLKDDRLLEARDCARAALQMPLWSISGEIEPVVISAESSMEQMRSSYEKWSTTGGPEEDFVNTGDNEGARALGRARYTLDKVVLNAEMTYASVRDELAGFLDAGNRPDMAKLVRS